MAHHQPLEQQLRRLGHLPRLFKLLGCIDREGSPFNLEGGDRVASLDQAFGLEHCFIGLFETLFTPGTYAELCSFLGIPYEEPSWSEKINVSATSTVIPDDLLATMGRMHADDLRRAAEALPSTDFPTLWPTTSRWSNS